MNAVNVVATYNIDGAVQGGPLAGDVQLASVRLDQYPRWPEGGSGSLLVRVLREGARAAPALACASMLNELDFLSLAQLRETSPSSRSRSASGVDSAADEGDQLRVEPRATDVLRLQCPESREAAPMPADHRRMRVARVPSASGGSQRLMAKRGRCVSARQRGPSETGEPSRTDDCA